MLTELILLVVIAGGAVAYGRERRQRERADGAGALMSAALGTINGVCYR